jgi:hypothetical protein
MSKKYNPAKPKEEQIELLSDEELLSILAEEEDTEEDEVLDLADMSDYPKLEDIVDDGLEHRGIKIYTKLRDADSILPKSLPEYDPDEYYVIQWLVQYAGLEPGTECVVPRAWLYAAYVKWLEDTFSRARVEGILKKKEPCYFILKKFFPVGVTHITGYNSSKHAAVMDDTIPVTAQRWDVGVNFKKDSPYNYRKLMELGLPKLTSEQIDKRLEKEKAEAEVAAHWRKVRYEKEKRREQWRRNMQIHEERKAKKAAWKAKQEAKYEKYGKVAPWLKPKSEPSE